MKILTLALLCAAPSWAALTTVTDTIYNGTGGLATGTIRITPVVRFTSQGNEVYGITFSTNISRGVFSVNLSPTDVAVPTNIYYIVRYSINGNPGTAPTEYWVVPTSVTPVGLSTVRSTPTANPTVMFSVAQLTCPSDCRTGQSIVWNGTRWINGVGGVPCTLTATVSTTCTHNLNSLNVGIDVYDSTGKESRAYKDITRSSVNAVVITFDTAFTGTAIIK